MSSQIVRSIFYYNAPVELGQEIRLHLFEPRYRIMVKRALEAPCRQRQICWLCNFGDYTAAHGDLGFVATVTQVKLIPVGPDELPRADVTLRMDARAVVLMHWVEPRTGGLHEAALRVLDDAPLPPAAALQPRLDALMTTSSDKRYVVRTQRGFLNVHDEPTIPYDHNLAGRLAEGEVVVELERRRVDDAVWMRHDPIA